MLWTKLDFLYPVINVENPTVLDWKCKLIYVIVTEIQIWIMFLVLNKSFIFSVVFFVLTARFFLKQNQILIFIISLKFANTYIQNINYYFVCHEFMRDLRNKPTSYRKIVCLTYNILNSKIFWIYQRNELSNPKQPYNCVYNQRFQIITAI